MRKTIYTSDLILKWDIFTEYVKRFGGTEEDLEVLSKAANLLRRHPLFCIVNHTRFSDADIFYAEKRLGTTWENTVDIVKVFDRGVGDIDDVIDLYENTKPI